MSRTPEDPRNSRDVARDITDIAPGLFEVFQAHGLIEAGNDRTFTADEFRDGLRHGYFMGALAQSQHPEEILTLLGEYESDVQKRKAA